MHGFRSSMIDAPVVGALGGSGLPVAVFGR